MPSDSQRSPHQRVWRMRLWATGFRAFMAVAMFSWGTEEEFKGVSASTDFYIGVHVLHFRHAVPGDGFILLFHGSGKHFPVQPRLVQAQKGKGSCGAYFPDEGHSHFFRNIR